MAFSPDERLLYIAESGAPNVDNPKQYIRVFEIQPNGATLKGGDIFHKVEPGFSDGFRVDEDGNIWSSAANGVHCISSVGELLGKIFVPHVVANVTFGELRKEPPFHCGFDGALLHLPQHARSADAMSTVQRLSRISLICREPDRLGCFYERAFGFVRSKQSETGGTALKSLLRIPGAEAKVIRMGLGEQTIELVGIKPEAQAYPQKFRRGALCFSISLL